MMRLQLTRRLRYQVWYPIKRKISCDCYHAVISSRSCHKCGKHGTISKERVDEMLKEFTWMHYAVGRAMYEFNPDQGEVPNPGLAHLWLRTTLPKDHSSYISPKQLGYGNAHRS